MYKKALDLNPNDVNITQNFAYCCLNAQKFEKAIPLFKKAIEARRVDPKEVARTENIIEICRQSNIKAPMQYFNKIVEEETLRQAQGKAYDARKLQMAIQLKNANTDFKKTLLA